MTNDEACDLAVKTCSLGNDPPHLSIISCKQGVPFSAFFA